jgi:hypothetical protein
MGKFFGRKVGGALSTAILRMVPTALVKRKLARMNSSLLGLFGTILQFVAVILSIVLGFNEQLAVVSIIICSLILEIAWVFIRLPQIIGIWQREGIKVGGIFLYGWLLYSALAAVLYSIGFGISRFF